MKNGVNESRKKEERMIWLISCFVLSSFHLESQAKKNINGPTRLLCPHALTNFDFLGSR